MYVCFSKTLAGGGAWVPGFRICIPCKLVSIVFSVVFSIVFSVATRKFVSIVFSVRWNI